MFFHDGHEFTIGKILKAPVDTEREVLAGTRATDTFHVLDNVMPAILDNTLGTRLSPEPVLIGQLQTLLADVIDVGKTDNLCRHLTARVITMVLALQINTRHPQR